LYVSHAPGFRFFATVTGQRKANGQQRRDAGAAALPGRRAERGADGARPRLVLVALALAPGGMASRWEASPPAGESAEDYTQRVVADALGARGLADLEAHRRRRQALMQDSSPSTQQRLLEAMEAETLATRRAAEHAGASPYSAKPTPPMAAGSPLSDGGSSSSSPRRSYRESPRRTPSPRSPASPARASAPDIESSFQRRVQFGADRTLSFHQSAAERLAQRCDQLVAVIVGAFDDGHASLEKMQHILRGMDLERTGIIDAGDFGWAIEDMELGLDVHEIDELVEALDARSEDVVEYNVLLAALGAPPGPEEPTEPDPERERGPEPEPEPEPEPKLEPIRATVASAVAASARAAAVETAASRAAAAVAGAGEFEEVIQTTGVDPQDPNSVEQLAAFNDRLEAEVRRGLQASSEQQAAQKKKKLELRPTAARAAASPSRRKPQLTGRAAEVAANARKPKGEAADLWECTFEPNTRPQVLNRHGMVGVGAAASTARTQLLQEYVARELQIGEVDYMSDRMLDEVVAEAAANGWLTQSNVKLVKRKHGTEKLTAIANILKARNSMALVDAQLKQVQEEHARERATTNAAEERTNAQAQKAWMSDLRPITPNRARNPWKPTRGVGTADCGDSPRRIGNMGHDESVLMKQEHDSKYGRYSANAVPPSSPRLVHAANDGKKPMSFNERMQADIAKRQRKEREKDKAEKRGGRAGQFQAARASPSSSPSASPRRSSATSSPASQRRRGAGQKHQRRPSKMSPPRPARVSRSHRSPERATGDSWLGKPDSHETSSSSRRGGAVTSAAVEPAAASFGNSSGGALALTAGMTREEVSPVRPIQKHDCCRSLLPLTSKSVPVHRLLNDSFHCSNR
jgi:hypothetical protein